MSRSVLFTAFVSVFLLSCLKSSSQSLTDIPIHGNTQLDAQYYRTDSAIRAPDVPEQMLFNGFTNFTYEKDNFSAGLRYEAYLNPILGYDKRYEGNGIPFRFLTYRNNELEITAGNFYEQFGMGMALRTYNEWGLGYDNSIDGLRIKYTPLNGVTFKGLVGKQRDFWSKGAGIVRGFDTEWNLNESISPEKSRKSQWILGGSFVSKYQKDDDPTYILPQNVATGGGRLSFTRGGFTAYTEYVFKSGDPSEANKYIFKDGQALYLNLGYTKKGLGITVGTKWLDNMNYRSDRNAIINSLLINYMPVITKNHTYLLAAYYPYATQLNGEFGVQGEVFCHWSKEHKLAGPYGTDFTFNYSRTQSIHEDPITSGVDTSLGYKTSFFSIGEELYYEDFNITIDRKLNKKTRAILTYMRQAYNKEVIEGRDGFGIVRSHIGVLEIQHRITPKKSIRTEAQVLLTDQDQGSWALLLAEYTVAPHWFVAVFDQYNYGNPDQSLQLHYYTVQTGYTRGSNRVTIGYGRQRAGILCVGGVCRNVPSANGLTLSVTSSF
ncbi:MAG: DUF6029 family protein [Bacteroidota bacterium]